MKYIKLWSSMHDNPHRNQVKDIENWYYHMKKMYDFWPIAYYPFGMIDTGKGISIEDIYEKNLIDKDWEEVRRICNLANSEGYPMFMGFEWQGNGQDGDHNVFFKDNNQYMQHPLTYKELYEQYKDIDCIAIPHHIAYHLGDRGKNWKTHIEKFSPFAEIYSSHGCSENDLNFIPMQTHIHMGPRVDNTSYDAGLNQGISVGCICSGDNHLYPGQYDNGSMCALAVNNSKEAIWDALVNSRVYGVTKGRIDIDFKIDNACMGEHIKESQESNLQVNVIGNSEIDRIEVLKDNILDHVYTHQGKWERISKDKYRKFKMFIEFGWGPDMRVFPDIYKKHWNLKLNTTAKIISVEKCYNSIGSKIKKQEFHNFEADLITYKSSGSGKWMGQSSVKTEGYILEFEGNIKDVVNLSVDGREYSFILEELMIESKLYGDIEAARNLIKERFGDIASYRNDTWWHNSYKFKINRVIPDAGYCAKFEYKINTLDAKHIRIKVYQKNGSVGFVSPIFIERDL